MNVIGYDSIHGGGRLLMQITFYFWENHFNIWEIIFFSKKFFMVIHICLLAILVNDKVCRSDVGGFFMVKI